MKTTKQNFVIVLIIAAVMQSFTIKAQNDGFKSSATVARPGTTVAGWQPFKLNDKGTNALNGVDFYIEKAECSTGKAILIKLFNTNNYAVKVTYQTSADRPLVNVLVQALTTIEGSCTVTDGNLGKLVVTPPAAATDEAKQKNKEFLRTHITVTKA